MLDPIQANSIRSPAIIGGCDMPVSWEVVLGIPVGKVVCIYVFLLRFALRHIGPSIILVMKETVLYRPDENLCLPFVPSIRILYSIDAEASLAN